MQPSRRVVGQFVNDPFRSATGDRFLPILTTYGGLRRHVRGGVLGLCAGTTRHRHPGAAPGVWTSFGNVESSPSPFPAILIGLLLGTLALHLLAHALRYQGFHIVRESKALQLTLLRCVPAQHLRFRPDPIPVRHRHRQTGAIPDVSYKLAIRDHLVTETCTTLHSTDYALFRSRFA